MESFDRAIEIADSNRSLTGKLLSLVRQTLPFLIQINEANLFREAKPI